MILQARYFNRNQKDESQNEFIFGLVLGQTSKGLLPILSKIIKINKPQ